MDERLLKIKIEELFNTQFILRNSLTKNESLVEEVRSIFSNDELKYINTHSYLLEPYIKIKIQTRLIKKDEYSFLETDLGTYLIDDDTFASNNSSIDLISFYKVLVMNSGIHDSYKPYKSVVGSKRKTACLSSKLILI